MLDRKLKLGFSYALMVEGDPEEYPYDIKDFMCDHLQKPPEPPKNLIVEMYPGGKTRVMYRWENNTWNRMSKYGKHRKVEEEAKTQEDNK